MVSPDKGRPAPTGLQNREYYTGARSFSSVVGKYVYAVNIFTAYVDYWSHPPAISGNTVISATAPAQNLSPLKQP